MIIYRLLYANYRIEFNFDASDFLFSFINEPAMHK